MGSNSAQRPAIAAAVTVVLWAFAFPASRMALGWFDVEQIALLRYLVASGFYLVLFALGMFPLPRLRDVPVLGILGLLGVTTYQLLFVFGMGKVAGGAAAMIITANPVIAALLARFFLNERLSALSWIGIFIGIGGIAVISLIKGTDGEPAGYLALLVAVMAISIYFVFQKPFFKRYSPLAMISYTTILGTLPLLAFLPATAVSLTEAPALPIIWILVMGIFSSGVGFLLWFYSLSKMPVEVVTSFLFLQPVIVTAMSWAWLSEIPETKTLIGGAIVFAGLGLIILEQLKRTASSSSPTQ